MLRRLRVQEGQGMEAVELVYRYQRGGGLERPRPEDAGAALRRLDDGNRQFASLWNPRTDGPAAARQVIPLDADDFGVPAEGVAPTQRPFAAVLGCADARVPVEMIFGEAANDLFVVRVAGNVLGSEVLGSLSYAIEHLGGSLRVVAVLGHSGCGAMSAAVDMFLSPVRYLSVTSNHALRSVLDRMLVVVQASAKRLALAFGPDVTSRPRYREALIECAITINAALAAHTLRQEVAHHGNGEKRAVFGVYLLDLHRVWAPRPGGGEPFGLTEPPSDEASFFELGTAIIESDRIAALLQA